MKGKQNTSFVNVIPQKSSKKPAKKAFTLVELIVVITILAILATIAFISFQNFTSDARDSDRLVTLSNAKKGLDLIYIKTLKYPEPESIYGTGYGTFSGSNTRVELFKVGYIKGSIARMLNFSKTPRDPLSKDYYVYGVSYDNTEYQVATVLEGTLAKNNILLQQAYADAGLRAKVMGEYDGLIKRDNVLYNPRSLILPNIYQGWFDIFGNMISFVVDKGFNLPYALREDMSLTGGTIYSSTGISINDIRGNWNTLSGTYSSLLGVPVDVIGVEVFGEQEYFADGGTSSGGAGGGTGGGSNNNCNISGSTFLNLCSTGGKIFYTDITGQEIREVSSTGSTISGNPSGLNCSGHILVCSGCGTGYILQACNLGSTIVGTGTESYGLYFQWGNNYGSSSTGEVLSISIDAGSYPPSSFASTGFIEGTGSSYDWSIARNDNLWGDITNTNLARRGPCPEGYHVPSKSEWLGIYNSWRMRYEESSSSNNDSGGGPMYSPESSYFSNVFKMPFAGSRDTNGYYSNIMDSWGGSSEFGEYWSSSYDDYYDNNSQYWYRLNITLSSDDIVNIDSSSCRSNGMSIRCIKN